MGGSREASINDPANLLTLCGSGTTQCHGFVESHPGWSRDHGYSVSFYGTAPPRVPVWTWRGWVLLLTSGELQELPDHPGVDDCACGCNALDPLDVWVSPAHP